jgi:3-deoxy-7-phosphoheptulonate synthase / chorismate mutase
MMSQTEIDFLRGKVDEINLQILEMINERGRIVQRIEKMKGNQDVYHFDPFRERKMLSAIFEANNGPFEQSTIQHIFKEIFKAGLMLQEEDHSKALLVSRKMKTEDTIVNVKGEQIGNGMQSFIVGPCAVESYQQTAKVAEAAKKQGIRLLRGGAFKPRTSPYDFQGLGMEGLRILKQVADDYDMAVISEIVNPTDIEAAMQYIDVIQIGARNMQNFELLKAAGTVKKPVLLKRGISATLQEFMNAAEYIIAQGNDQIILCERGIRTYETATRNTLDISAVPILKQETHLPVFVDVTHSTGRRDLLLPITKAALAIGADGIMAEVHPEPAVALSDSAQQMNIDQFNEWIDALRPLAALKV